jgi:hypothetical protein
MADERDEREVDLDDRVVPLRERDKSRRRGPGRQSRDARETSRTGPGRKAVGKDLGAEKDQPGRDDVATAATTRGVDPLEQDGRAARERGDIDRTIEDIEADRAAADMRAAERESGLWDRSADTGRAAARRDEHVAEHERREPDVDPDRVERLEASAARRRSVADVDEDRANSARADAAAASAAGARSGGGRSLRDRVTPETVTAGQPEAYKAAHPPSTAPTARKGGRSAGRGRGHSRNAREK